MSNHLNIIVPEWDVPKYVKSLTTTRMGGVSKRPFDTFNLALHVGDDEQSVINNRKILKREWFLPSEPYWLNQTHSIDAIEITDKSNNHHADASWTSQSHMICAVMTADCLPLLVYDPIGNSVAAIHAGWRGLLNGIIENTISMMATDASACLVWLGPAIGPSSFEVGAEVKAAFEKSNQDNSVCFSESQNPGKFMANIYHLAKRRLNSLGINQISGGDYCTVLNEGLFYSYRRSGQTGRMATLIWMED